MRPPLSASSSAPDLHSSPFYPSASAGPRSATLPSYETQWNQPGSPSSSQFRDAPSTIKSSLQSFSIDHRSPPRSRSGSALSVTSSTSGIVNSQLYFAIASDRPSEVQRLLETGEVSPNDGSGPQNPLVFAASNEHLEHRSEIVRTLLAHGADPSVLDKHEQPESITENQDPQRNSLKAYDPSVRYYVSQAMNYKDHKPSAAIKSVPKFAPLARLRFKLIGQTLVLDEFYRALSIQALRGDNVPLVVLFCGPSGHGKSLMSRQVGDLLGCPIRFVNMTTLSSTQDVWDARSQSPTTDVIQSLGDFMCENEGKRCIVVLDEIEKTLNPRVLWALLVPWELGYCTLSSGRQVNTKEVIWIGISNLGQSMVLEASSLTEPAAGLSVGAYRELMSRVREKLSDELGSSLLSRVTAVLPFTPFSQEELEALAYDAVVATVTQRQTPLTEEDMTKVVGEAVRNYLPKEGARSLFRAVAEQMLDL
ncbi:P-loop containing nucleoside triphosphate hydrolase protein [Sistotremastrum suecicum HHB10207 ss-3]|uniref:p-loop containing nucleoside triphosphate hydrolase protein n=1 Tax=Sistotremastrum suecicum HHB10207 ss-3 TaxID=1314776 RepID=A0A165ZWV6_9AGAM|nr:P-loop containing nucleoside triphosphate hydrolase protein [Sistotremastrum suecicum HHB10207 ss-3]